MEKFEYYTELPKLPLKDYGRNVWIMLNQIKNLPNKEARNFYVKQILKSMSILNPQQKEMTDYHKKLWHHLFILANHQLDVDCPYDLSELEKNPSELPQEKLSYQYNPPKFKQYGKNVEILLSKILELPDGEHKHQQIQHLIHSMRLSVQKTTGEKIEDETLIKHIALLSEGKLVLNKQDFSPYHTPNLPPNNKPSSNKSKLHHKNKKFQHHKNKK